MADFGPQATQLSAPQGAGTSPVAAVQEAPNKAGLDPLIVGIGNIFAKGLEVNAKQEAAQKEAGVVSQFVNKQKVLDDAVISGQMRPEVAAAHSRALFGTIAATNPQYIESLQKAASALKGFGELGESQKAADAEKKVFEDQRSQAISRGYVFLPGMPPDVERQQVVASQTGIQAEKRMSAFHAEQAEKRAQGNYDAAVADKEAKDLGITLINDIAGQNLTAFQGFIKTLGDGVKNGTMKPEDAAIQLAERNANISAAITAAARANPELAGPYRTIFDQLNQVGKGLIDPKTVNEDTKAQLEQIQTRMKLVAMSNPKFAATIVSNQLLPNNPSLALSSASVGVEMIAALSENPTPGGYQPQVVQTPEEAGYLKLLKGSIQSMGIKKGEDKAMADIQASNNINAILTQTGKYIDQGVDPTRLKGLADFFSSPEYATMLSTGKINPQAATTAKRVFQLQYEPAVINGVQQRLTGYLFNPTNADGSAKPMARTEVQDAVDVKFTGSGIIFQPKPTTGLMDIEIRKQQEIVQSLNTSQKAINQLIHMGAHMEGTTNYAKYWEDNKHIYMPSMFPAPNKLKEGQVVDGYKYMGGNYRDKANWQRVESTTSK